MPFFGSASLGHLFTCDEKLQDLFHEVIKHVDCSIISGRRTAGEQQLLYAQGRTMPGRIITYCDGIHIKSNHQAVTPNGKGRAVDAVPYPIDWEDLDRFYHFTGFVRGVATQMGIPIISGIDWDNDYGFKDQNFYDFPHFELPEEKA